MILIHNNYMYNYLEQLAQDDGKRVQQCIILYLVRYWILNHL